MMSGSRPGISLATMCLALVYVALGMVALRQSDEAWTSVVVTMTFLTLLAASVRLLGAVGKGRRFWQGFLIFGWGLFAAMMFPGSGGGFGPMLVSSYLLNLISSGLFPDVSQPAGAGPAVVQYVGLRFRPLSPERHAFLLMGHCYITLLGAVFGGALAVSFARSQEKPAGQGAALDRTS
jgi:hypothetical protein